MSVFHPYRSYRKIIIEKSSNVQYATDGSKTNYEHNVGNKKQNGKYALQKVSKKSQVMIFWFDHLRILYTTIIQYSIIQN